MLKVGAGYAIGHLLGRLQMFLVLPLFIRGFSQEQYGVFETLMSVYMLCSGLAMFNFDALLPRFLNLEEPDRSGKVRGTWWIHAIVSLVIVAGAGLLMSAGVASAWISGSAFIWSSLAGVLFASNQIVNVFLRSTFQHQKAVFFLVFFSTQFALAALLTVLAPQMSVTSFFQFLSLLYLISMFVGVALIRSHRKTQQVSAQVGSVFHEAIPLLGFTFIAWILNFSDRIFVSQLLGVESTAEFGFAIRLASLATLIFGPFQMMWLPWAMKILRIGKAQESFHIVASLLIAAIGILMGGMLISESVLLWFFSGGQFKEAFRFVGPLVVAQLCLFLYYLPMARFVFDKKSHLSTISFSIGAILNVVLNLILIPRIGLWGPVIANLVGYSVTMAVSLLLASRLPQAVRIGSLDFILLLSLLLFSMAPALAPAEIRITLGILIILGFGWRGFSVFQKFQEFHRSVV